MKLEDIQINHHYRLEIWEEEYNYLQCTNEEEGWFEMTSFHLEFPMLLMHCDDNIEELIEISHDEYHKWEATWKHKHTSTHTSTPELLTDEEYYEALFDNC